MYARKKGMTLLLAAILGASLSLTAQSALASDDGRGATRGVAQLAAAWFRWQETNFGTANFDFGEGLVDCSVGQRGDVWFLGGSDGSQPVERECIRRIPKKTRLFFPLVNLVFFNEPGEDLSVPEKRALLAGILDDLEAGALATESCRLNATVDGRPVILSRTAIQRVQSTRFKYGEDRKAVADGFWVLLPRLARGEHIIKFGGSLCEFETGSSIGFDIDVTYLLTVGGRHHRGDHDDD